MRDLTRLRNSGDLTRLRDSGDLTRLRNFGVIAHIDAGKTTLSERMLYVSGRIHAIGETHDGAAALDHLAQERDRGITITAAATSIEWNDHRLNLVDTPGHVDFTVEVERSLRVLDGAVVVVDAVAGVEPQSETVWRQADRNGLPRIVFVNKMDRDGADLHAAIASIEDRLDARCALVQLPIGEQGECRGVVDLVHLTARIWASTDPQSDTTTALHAADLPTPVVDEAHAARARLVERIAEHDDDVLHVWSDEGAAAVTAAMLDVAIGKATAANDIVPVLCGTALGGVGVQPLLDSVVAWLPSPVDAATISTDPNGPFCALAFKVRHGVGGRVVWSRVYAGSLRKGDHVRNSTNGRKERISRILQLHAGRTTDVDAVSTGDIAAFIGTKSTTTGDTLCDPAHDVVLESIEFPDPVMSIVVEPEKSADQDKLGTALARLADEDPTFAVRTDPETGETLMAGMGELHLQVLVQSLRDDHGVAVRTGEPRVACRETITEAVMGWEYRLSKQTGGPGMFAKVVVDVTPDPSRDLGLVSFDDQTRGGAVPAAFAAAFAAGATDALSQGPIEGHPVVGVKITLTDGLTHPNDSNEAAFRLAGAHVIRDVVAAAAPVVLEPIMDVVISTPDEHVGAVMGLIGQKRGVPNELVETTGTMEVQSRIPLAELFGFVGELRSVSQGRASASMTLAGYEPRPA